ncbi:MAG: hypothetical protein IIU80_02535 [Clostridia bacterium]|nr:hypothetical protein [Clostridia bacterium]
MNQVIQMLLVQIALIILSVILALTTRFSKIKGCSDIVKEKKIKNKRTEALIYTIIAVLAIIWTSYCSLDVIKQDYIVEDLQLVSYGKSQVFSGIKEFNFDVGKLYSFSEDGLNYNLEKETTYKVTYARRTSVIISIEGETKSVGLKTIFKYGSIGDILFLLLLLAIYLVGKYMIYHLRYSKPKTKWKKR